MMMMNTFLHHDYKSVLFLYFWGGGELLGILFANNFPPDSLEVE